MHIGKKHGNLGVDMESNNDGIFDISMIKYLQNLMEDFPEVITGRASTPAADHLFSVRDKKEAITLEEEQALVSHHTVAQLLFMSTKARQDIQTAVTFLTMRVKTPDKDNWGKLKQVLKYLNGTKYLKQKLSINNLGMLKWYVDGCYNVHWDYKGQGGPVFTMGKGATSIYSRKMKVNTRSSTETELITADMIMLEMLWALHFIQAQGYSPECVGLYQDNISTQLLIKNVRILSGMHTKHIKVKFFFIKNRVDDKEIKVFDCPTHKVWADVFDKTPAGNGIQSDEGRADKLSSEL
jgi:hypothetical protein